MGTPRSDGLPPAVSTEALYSAAILDELRGLRRDLSLRAREVGYTPEDIAARLATPPAAAREAMQALGMALAAVEAAPDAAEVLNDADVGQDVAESVAPAGAGVPVPPGASAPENAPDSEAATPAPKPLVTEAQASAAARTLGRSDEVASAAGKALAQHKAQTKKPAAKKPAQRKKGAK